MRELVQLYVWAKKYIDYFDKNEYYDHYDAVVGSESRKQMVYNECEKFIAEINKATENFKSARDKLIKWGGSGTEETLYK